MTLHRAAACLKPGKTRRGLTRFLRIALPKLEFCLRCLLVGMRAEATLTKPAHFTPRGESAERKTPHLRRPRIFSLSLKGIAPETAQPARRDITITAKAQTPTISGLPREETFAARLLNIEAVLRDPLTFAQKIAAKLKGRGLRLRALKALRPAAELWNLLSDETLRHAPQKREPLHPDTS